MACGPAPARGCLLLCLCWLLAAAALRGPRPLAQEQNFELIQNIKDKLVVSNEDYVPEESREAAFNFVIGKTQVQLNGTIDEPELAQFDFNIGHPVIKHQPEDPQSDGERKTMRREGKLALRLREDRKKTKEAKTTQRRKSTTGEFWDPYTTDLAKTRRVKSQSRNAPSTSRNWAASADTSAPWTPLQLRNVDPGAGSPSSILVYNFYPITQPTKRSNIEEWGVRGPTEELPLRESGIRKAMSSSEVLKSREQPSVRGEHPSGVVTFQYEAKIPVEVPLSKTWIANSFS